MAKFCAEESSKEKDSKIYRTDQKSNTEIGVISLYLCPILQWFYPLGHMVSFWCGNTLIEGDLKNENSPKYVGATRDQTTAFLRRKI